MARKNKLSLGSVVKHIGNTTKQISSSPNHMVKYKSHIENVVKPVGGVGHNTIKATGNIWSFWK